MNWRQFTVAMVQAVAWPSVALVALLVYRRRISALLGAGLRRLKAGPLEAEWEAVAEEARASIDAVAIAQLEEAASGVSEVEQYLRAARALVDFPTISLTYCRMAIETAMIELLPESASKQAVTLRRLVLSGRDAGVVGVGAAAIFDRLIALGNRGIHGEELTPAQAAEYVDLAEAFLALLAKKPEARLASAERG